MTSLMAWCGFLGGWFLVAGPVYQAARELREEALEREDFEQAFRLVDRPDPVSPWLWLFPPAHYVASRRRGRQHRDVMLASLSQDQRDKLISFMSRARGWLVVGTGALLIATNETWGLCEQYEWSELAFAGIWLVASFLAFGATAYQMHREASARGAPTA